MSGWRVVTDEAHIEEFWNRLPCGDAQVGGVQEYAGDYEAFFTAYDRYRYGTERHILQCLDEIHLDGKRVLEIGLGQGADSEQLIRRGAIWSGLDLTQESVDRVRTRLALRRLPYESVRRGSVLALPYDDHSFDVVFSHGVLHHVPEVRSAEREIHRVLSPTGELVVMLYAKNSLNYWVSISVVRRLGLLAMYLANWTPGRICQLHLANARSVGLWHYLKMSNFIHKNTDGPLNPYSKVYDLRAVRTDFPSFDVIRSHKQFMHAPPLPVHWLSLERALGWHLWLHMRPVPPQS